MRPASGGQFAVESRAGGCFPDVQMANCLPAMWETQVRSLGQEDPLEKEMATHSNFPLLPGKFHGWRSLVSYSPWGHRELDVTERLHFLFFLFCAAVTVAF